MPQDRAEALLQLQEAIFGNDRLRINELADYFGTQPPRALEIFEGVVLLHEKKREGYEAISRLLESSAKEHAAERVTTSFGKPLGWKFSEVPEKFTIGGTKPPEISEQFIYFQVGAHGRQTCAFRFDEAPKHGVGVHFVGYIHSRTSDHFLIRLDRDDGEAESLRIGCHGVTLERSLAFREFLGPVPRLISIFVQGEWVHVSVNGLPFWRHRRDSVATVRSISFDLQPLATNGADAVMLGFEIWKLGDRPAESIFRDAEFDTIDALKWHLEHDRTKQVYELIRSFPEVDIKPIEDEAMGFMTRLAASPKGYPEWAVRLVEERLSDAARKRWQDIAIRTVPPPSIEVENLTVRFYKDFAHAKHFMSLLRGGSETFNVIDGVSFKAYPGDVVGIIGHNGAGKSSLLRTIAGLIPIKNGLIRVKENFMLLRGGIGIQPHLTGRENVLSAGIYLGLTPAEAKSKIPDILEFSELGEAFDRPTKYYSDGMLSRLVFAIATSASPEILLLDELLGAGDISFQEKAKRRLDSFLASSRVVVVVTHSIDFVRNNCNKALVMAHGKQLYFGEPLTAVSVYLSHLHMSLGTQERGTRF